MCGIFGAYNIRKAAELTAVGMHAEQHRAMDFSGMVSTDGRYLYEESGEGIARNVFTSDMLNRLHGKHALGHIRYPTVDDDPTRDNVQPIIGHYCGVEFAVAHNGNLTNTEELARAYPRKTSLDTELIVRMLEDRSSGSIEDDIAYVLNQLRGSFALGILFPDRLIAAQDPQQNRPLSIGKNGGGYYLSSETVAFPTLFARFVSDVEAGTIVTIRESGLRTMRYAEPRLKRCPFEGLYFSHPSSSIYGYSVTKFRVALGEALEAHCPAPGMDYVMEIPDSAKFHAIGYARSGRSGMYMPGVIRSHYVGRSFIAATQALRDEEIAAKFGFTEDLINGSKIVLIDDSVVRGSTLPRIIELVRWLGAKEVHVRIATPPITHLCRYGIYMKGKDGRLVANEKTIEEMRIGFKADSLMFLPLDVLKQVWPEPEHSCFACMDGMFWD